MTTVLGVLGGILLIGSFTHLVWTGVPSRRLARPSSSTALRPLYPVVNAETKRNGGSPIGGSVGQTSRRLSSTQIRNLLLRAPLLFPLSLALHGTVPTIPTASAGIPGANGRIAFVREHDIFTMDANGTNVVNLTNTPCCNTEFNPRRSESDPAWSPDGSKLAFIRVTNNNAGVTTTRMHIMNADGSGIRMVPTGDGDATASPGSPAWSPAGDALVYHWQPDGLSVIERINIDGSGWKRLTPNNGSHSPAWSPDGHTIAFSRMRSGQADIFVMRPDGTEVMPLSSEPGHAVASSWSPDGTQIAYGTQFARDIYVIDADGSDQTVRTEDGEGPSWAPDGSKILFDSSRDDPDIPPHNVEIYAMNPDGTEQTRLTFTDALQESDPDWQALGNSLPSTETTTTIRIEKAAGKLRISGNVRPGHPERLVKVTFYGKRDGRFKKIASRTSTLSQTSHYSTSFQRPQRRTCKAISKFMGDGFHQISKAGRRFMC